MYPLLLAGIRFFAIFAADLGNYQEHNNSLFNIFIKMANLDLSKYGIVDVKEVLHNPSYEVLFEEETKDGLTGFDKGQVTECININTNISINIFIYVISM